MTAKHQVRITLEPKGNTTRVLVESARRVAGGDGGIEFVRNLDVETFVVTLFDYENRIEDGLAGKEVEDEVDSG